MWKKYAVLTDEEKEKYISRNFENLLIEYVDITETKAIFEQGGIGELGWKRLNDQFVLYTKGTINDPLSLIDEKNVRINKNFLGFHDTRLELVEGNLKIIEVRDFEKTGYMKKPGIEKRIEELFSVYDQQQKTEKRRMLQFKTLFGITEKIYDWLDQQINDLELITPTQREKINEKVDRMVELSRGAIEKHWGNEEYKQKIKTELDRRKEYIYVKKEHLI